MTVCLGFQTWACYSGHIRFRNKLKKLRAIQTRDAFIWLPHQLTHGGAVLVLDGFSQTCSQAGILLLLFNTNTSKWFLIYAQIIRGRAAMKERRKGERMGEVWNKALKCELFPTEQEGSTAGPEAWSLSAPLIYKWSKRKTVTCSGCSCYFYSTSTHTGFTRT